MNYSITWSKALLYAQRYVASVCRQIDEAVQKRVVLIPGLNVGLFDVKDTLCQTEKVISFIEQKKRTLKLAVMCGEIFDCMKPLLKKTLFLKYRSFKSGDEAVKILGCSKRSYFRYINQGITSFTKLREKMCLSDEYLESIYGKDNWIIRFKEKALQEENTKEKIVNVKTGQSKILYA